MRASISELSKHFWKEHGNVAAVCMLSTSKQNQTEIKDGYVSVSTWNIKCQQVIVVFSLLRESSIPSLKDGECAAYDNGSCWHVLVCLFSLSLLSSPQTPNPFLSKRRSAIPRKRQSS